MLPFSGQGANQAIEDGGALGYLLEGVEDGAGIRDRLLLFERARKGRASRVQTLSKVRVGKEKEVEEELRSYAEPPGSGISFKLNNTQFYANHTKPFLPRCRNVQTMIMGMLKSMKKFN